MSSTGIINGIYDDLEADNIEVNDSLYVIILIKYINPKFIITFIDNNEINSK